MGRRDPEVDAYIEEAEPFARPVLRHLREVVHEACPDVEEKMRWSFPTFDHHGILCSMAAFKAHCTFGFWKPDLVMGDHPQDDSAMGQLGRIASVEDLPSRDVLSGWIRKAAELNEAGIKPLRTRRKKEPRPELPVPDDLAAALDADDAARTAFEGFSPSHRREYVEWITEAKREATRRRRIEQAVAWLAEGKPRNWKYTR